MGANDHPDEEVGQMVPGQGGEELPLQDQIGAVWTGLMSQMTAAGATRIQIAEVAARTAQTILTLTAGALWEGSTIPPDEQDVADRIIAAMGELPAV